MKLNMEQMQEIVSDMLRETVRVCEENEIVYYAQAGTVLGTIRHGGPIPWDYDADIIVPQSEMDRFVECIHKYINPKYYIDYFKVDDSTMRQFPRIGMRGFSTAYLHLDVFRLIGLPEDRDSQLEMIKEARDYSKKIAIMRKPVWKIICKGQFKLAFYKITDKNKYLNLFDELCNRFFYKNASFVMNPSGKYGEKNIFKKEVYGEGCKKKYVDFELNIPKSTDFYLKQYYGDYMKFPPKDETDKEMNRVFVVK